MNLSDRICEHVCGKLLKFINFLLVFELSWKGNIVLVICIKLEGILWALDKYNKKSIGNCRFQLVYKKEIAFV